jgi:ABC-2 type transport system permease protein
MDKIITIIRKEWAEVFKNKMVFFTVVFLPLLFAALPLIIMFTTEAGVGILLATCRNKFPLCVRAMMSGSECFQVYIVSQFLILFMLVPLIIPVNIAAYSIVGEKTTRSLEPLLATPITTTELLIGKNLAAVIPAVLATLGSFLIFAAGAGFLSGLTGGDLSLVGSDVAAGGLAGWTIAGCALGKLCHHGILASQ